MTTYYEPGSGYEPIYSSPPGVTNPSSGVPSSGSYYYPSPSYSDIVNPAIDFSFNNIDLEDGVVDIDFYIVYNKTSKIYYVFNVYIDQNGVYKLISSYYNPTKITFRFPKNGKYKFSAFIFDLTLGLHNTKSVIFNYSQFLPEPIVNIISYDKYVFLKNYTPSKYDIISRIYKEADLVKSITLSYDNETRFELDYGDYILTNIHSKNSKSNSIDFSVTIKQQQNVDFFPTNTNMEHISYSSDLFITYDYYSLILKNIYGNTISTFDFSQYVVNYYHIKVKVINNIIFVVFGYNYYLYVIKLTINNNDFVFISNHTFYTNQYSFMMPLDFVVESDILYGIVVDYSYSIPQLIKLNLINNTFTNNVLYYISFFCYFASITFDDSNLYIIMQQTYPYAYNNGPNDNIFIMCSKSTLAVQPLVITNKENSSIQLTTNYLTFPNRFRITKYSALEFRDSTVTKQLQIPEFVILENSLWETNFDLNLLHFATVTSTSTYIFFGTRSLYLTYDGAIKLSPYDFYTYQTQVSNFWGYTLSEFNIGYMFFSRPGIFRFIYLNAIDNFNPNNIFIFYYDQQNNRVIISKNSEYNTLEFEGVLSVNGINYNINNNSFPFTVRLFYDGIYTINLNITGEFGTYNVSKTYNVIINKQNIQSIHVNKYYYKLDKKLNSVYKMNNDNIEKIYGEYGEALWQYKKPSDILVLSNKGVFYANIVIYK